MITRYGMSQDFDMVALETVNNQYLGGDTSLALLCPDPAGDRPEGWWSWIKAQHAKALQILTENRDKLDQLAKFLYERRPSPGRNLWPS